MASPKQIEWATRIRDEKLAEVRQIVETATQNKDKAQHALDLLERRKADTHANFWIDKRTYDGFALMSYVLKREQQIKALKEILDGKSDPFDAEHSDLFEFLHLIDDKVVPATSLQRKHIYDAMVQRGEATSAKERLLNELDRKAYYARSEDERAALKQQIADTKARALRSFLDEAPAPVRSK